MYVAKIIFENGKSSRLAVKFANETVWIFRLHKFVNTVLFEADLSCDLALLILLFYVVNTFNQRLLFGTKQLRILPLSQWLRAISNGPNVRHTKCDVRDLGFPCFISGSRKRFWSQDSWSSWVCCSLWASLHVQCTTCTAGRRWAHIHCNVKDEQKEDC